MRSRIKSFLTVLTFLGSLPVFASNLHYAVIIDAGSSGSRAHVFEYENVLPLLPVIKDLFDDSTSPGLSSYANHSDDAGASLKPILDKTALYLKEKGVNLPEVSISVLATAGMRLLSLSEQQAVYDGVRRYIRANYMFSLNDQNVRTITGTQEGVYGWLDVNYLSNNFIQPSTTVGSIDMGGASTQIAFVTSDTTQSEHEVVLTINHTRYRVFSRSFLGLGQDQVRQTMTVDEASSSCYPDGYTYESQKTGHFDFAGCSDIYAGIIKNQDVKQITMPTAEQHFVAYAGIFYNYSYLNTLHTPTQSALESQINTVCYQPWDTLQSNYTTLPARLLSTFCANGVYFDNLLYNTYQLQESQLTVTDAINGTSIDWTLGALLYSLVS
ncbi:hypothetical protein N9Q05_02510 [bacterium]|nr:hypothetical protein [bacterium]